MQPEITESPQGLVPGGTSVVVKGQLGDRGPIAHEVTLDGTRLAHEWRAGDVEFTITFVAPAPRSEGQIVLVTVRNGHGEDSKAIPLART